MFATPDLHSHSTASDGSLTPRALVAHAQGCGVTTLALTDHDTTDGLEEAACAARACGIRFVPGIEISVTWSGRTLHVVGLNLDHNNRELQHGLLDLVAFRTWRGEEMARRLEKHGISGAYAGAQSFAHGRILSRTHFAQFLVSQRVASKPQEVFKRYLGVGKPGYVPGQWASLEQALGWIHAAGGQAVIAHPARYSLTRTRMLRLLGEFRELGGDGIEVLSGSHSRDDALTFARHAREQRLLASAGSDFHGPEHHWIEMGRLPALPEGCTPIWRDWPLAADNPAPAQQAAAG